MRLALLGQYYPLSVGEVFLARAKTAVRTTRAKASTTKTIVSTKFHQRRRKKVPSDTNTSSTSGKVGKILFFLTVTILSIGIFLGVLRGVQGNPDERTIRTQLEKRSQPFELSPERGRYASIMALDETQSFALSTDLRDVAYPDVGYIDGRYYSYFAPGISLFAYPFYEIGKEYDLAQVASFGMVSLFALCNMFVIYKISRNIFKLPEWADLFAAVVFAFGSTSLSYANTLYQHQVTAFFILSGFYAVWKFSQRKKYSSLWSIIPWINYGLAILIDYPNVVLLFPVMVYLLIETIKIAKEHQRIYLSVRFASVLASVIFFVITAFHGYYNYVNFGSPLRVSGSLIGYKEIQRFKLLTDTNGMEKLKEFEAKKQPVGFFKEVNLPFGLYTLLFADDKGLFFFAPIFLIALLDLFHILPRIDRRYGVLFATVGVNLFLYSSFDDPWGGFAYGPRYLIPTMSILSIFVAEWLVHTKKKILMKTIAFMLFIFSAAVALLGALTTNAVPPKVEAIPLKSAYNFMLNLKILGQGVSSSYLYNTQFSSIPLTDYFFALLTIILFLGFVTLFIYPLFSDSYDN